MSCHLTPPCAPTDEPGNHPLVSCPRNKCQVTKRSATTPSIPIPQLTKEGFIHRHAVSFSESVSSDSHLPMLAPGTGSCTIDFRIFWWGVLPFLNRAYIACAPQILSPPPGNETNPRGRPPPVGSDLRSGDPDREPAPVAAPQKSRESLSQKIERALLPSYQMVRTGS